MTTECRRSFHVGRGTSWTGAAEALSREFDTVGTSQFLRTHHVWRDDQISCVPMSCSSTTPPSCWSPSCPHLPLRITHGCCSFSFSPVSEVFQICSLLSFPWHLPAFRPSSLLPWKLLSDWPSGESDRWKTLCVKTEAHHFLQGHKLTLSSWFSFCWESNQLALLCWRHSRFLTPKKPLSTGKTKMVGHLILSSATPPPPH